MPRSGYIAAIRRRVGGALVLVPSVTACIFDDQDRLLLLRHADRDVWATPGGTIEPGESPADAVVRECREELDVLVEPTAILGVFGGPEYEVRYDNGGRTAYVMTAFDCRITRGDVRPDGVEAYEARFVADGRVAGPACLAVGVRRVAPPVPAAPDGQRQRELHAAEPLRRNRAMSAAHRHGNQRP